jgi:hypothetical protein
MYYFYFAAEMPIHARNHYIHVRLYVRLHVRFSHSRGQFSSAGLAFLLAHQWLKLRQDNLKLTNRLGNQSHFGGR